MDSLEAGIRRALLPMAADLGLDPGWIAIERVLNWGGFVNRSFAVESRGVRVHVKLVDAEHQPGLLRWREFRDRLAGVYHAPAMLEWIDVPDLGLSGPVFEWIDGVAPSALEGALWDGIRPTVARLHVDGELADRLAAKAPISSCAEAYLSSYDDRFRADLALVEADPPPFLRAADLAWLTEEVEVLREMVMRAPAFEEPASAPCHRDLWLNNILVSPSGHWFLLDWDDLGLGDPAMDWAMLLGPSRFALEPASWNRLQDVLRTRSGRARARVHARASLLDWVIDPLADWIDADRDPVHGPAIRVANARVHREALDLYRRRHGRAG